jgi:hypothetical protein
MPGLIRRKINIPAGAITEIPLYMKANTFVVRNHTAYTIYLNQTDNFDTSNADAVVQAGSYGAITDLSDFDRVYVYCASEVTALKTQYGNVPNPLILLPSTFNSVLPSGGTSVTLAADSIGLATSAKQTTIIGHIDGIETSLTTIEGYIDGLEGYVDGLEAKLDTLAAELIPGAELASAQYSVSAAAVDTRNRHASGSVIEIHVESGSVRVRTDGTAATATTGEPLAAISGVSVAVAAWRGPASISVYAVTDAVYTIVSR